MTAHLMQCAMPNTYTPDFCIRDLIHEEMRSRQSIFGNCISATFDINCNDFATIAVFYKETDLSFVNVITAMSGFFSGIVLCLYGHNVLLSANVHRSAVVRTEEKALHCSS